MRCTPDAIEQLATAIAQLQRDYFARLERPISEVLAVGAYGFLRNSSFVAAVERLLQQKCIVDTTL